MQSIYLEKELRVGLLIDLWALQIRKVGITYSSTFAKKNFCKNNFFKKILWINFCKWKNEDHLWSVAILCSGEELSILGRLTEAS